MIRQARKSDLNEIIKLIDLGAKNGKVLTRSRQDILQNIINRW